MFCEKCGTQLPESSTFCSNCGAPTNMPKQSENKKTTNGLAIAGFVCSFFVNIVGLILSIIGLCQCNSRGEDGKGFAIAGIIISSISLLLSLIFISLLPALVGSIYPLMYYL